MIARLVGEVVSGDGARVVLDVQGVGYAVHGSGKDMESWLASEERVTLHIHTDVREDAITLYGFTADLDRVTFERLRTVNGVGPKVALATLNTLSLEGLSSAVENGDVKALCAIPGVGKKLAQRLALELKGKLPMDFTPTAGPVAAPVNDDQFALALARLGYTRSEINRARTALEAQDLGVDAPLPDRVVAALKVLSGG